MSIAPRIAALNGRLDGRFACLIQAEGTIRVSIHETEDELEEALNEARQWYGEDAWCSSDTILIPRFD